VTADCRINRRFLNSEEKMAATDPWTAPVHDPDTPGNHQTGYPEFAVVSALELDFADYRFTNF
jgi:hypothetical protein